MLLEIAKYLEDVRQACVEISAYIEGVNFDEYLADGMRLAAVERKLEIIGEALSQARKIDASIDQSIRDLRQIIAFRNIPVHSYASINHKTVWGVLESDMPFLRQQVESLLASFKPNEPSS